MICDQPLWMLETSSVLFHLAFYSFALNNIETFKQIQSKVVKDNDRALRRWMNGIIFAQLKIETDGKREKATRRVIRKDNILK